MFNEGTLQERYNSAVYVRGKTRKVAKIFAIIYMIVLGLLMVVAVFASNIVENGVTAGAVILAVSGTPVGYLAGYIFGSCISWTYYWLERKFHMEDPIYLTLFITGYVGIFVWLKYRKYADKLEVAARKNYALQ